MILTVMRGKPGRTDTQIRMGGARPILLQPRVLSIAAKLAPPPHVSGWWIFDWVSCNFQDTSRKVFKTSEYVYLVLIRSNPGSFLDISILRLPRVVWPENLTGSGNPGAWGGGGVRQFCCNGEYTNHNLHKGGRNHNWCYRYRTYRRRDFRNQRLPRVHYTDCTLREAPRNQRLPRVHYTRWHSARSAEIPGLMRLHQEFIREWHSMERLEDSEITILTERYFKNFRLRRSKFNSRNSYCSNPHNLSN